MVLVDSDVFVLDLFYPTDPRAEANRGFIEAEIPLKATTVFNVLEICGIASFNKSEEDLKRLFYEFHQTYGLDILYPDVEMTSAEDFLKHLVARTFSRILLKMNFSDALILQMAESAGVTILVTWNEKHFADRTSVQIVNPRLFLHQSM